MMRSILLVALAGAAPAMAQTITVPLSGLLELPTPIVTQASGSAELTFDASTGLLSWHVMWTNLNNGNGNNTALFAHIHAGNGPARSNGPVVVDFGNALPGMAMGSANINSLSLAVRGRLWAGLGYVNVHSATTPSGELRGDIPAGFIPAPGAAALIGLGALAAGRRRR
jgi:MYXO-CTERM domain-containing protein